MPSAPRTISLGNSLPPESDSGPTAIASRSPCCSANGPGRPNPHPGCTPLPTPDPVRSQYPKKRHSPAPPAPGPAPSIPTHILPIPTTAPFLPTSPPQSRNLATALETHAHLCYARIREGLTPRLGSPTPNRALGPCMRRGIPCGCPGDSEGTAGRPRSVPLSSSATRRDICAPNCPSQHYRIAQHRRHSQLRDAQNVAETNRFRLPAFTGTTALGAHGNLEQAPAGGRAFRQGGR